MSDRWSPSFLANPTRCRQELTICQLLPMLSSAKSADTMSVVLGAVELNRELTDDCGTDHVLDD